jgi:hypothetical protein
LPKKPFRRCASWTGSVALGPSCGTPPDLSMSGARVPLRLDLLLQDLEAVEHLLGARRAARHVDVDRDDAVGALHGRVVVVEAARRGADAERHHPLRLAHLLVDAEQHRRLLDVDGADDHQQVGLARREARELGAEARDVVAARHRAHVLHAAAGGDERVLEERVRARPAERVRRGLLSKRRRPARSSKNSSCRVSSTGTAGSSPACAGRLGNVALGHDDGELFQRTRLLTTTRARPCATRRRGRRRG